MKSLSARDTKWELRMRVVSWHWLPVQRVGIIILRPGDLSLSRYWDGGWIFRIFWAEVSNEDLVYEVWTWAAPSINRETRKKSAHWQRENPVSPGWLWISGWQGGRDWECRWMERSFWSDGNVLKVYSGDGCTTL